MTPLAFFNFNAEFLLLRSIVYSIVCHAFEVIVFADVFVSCLLSPPVLPFVAIQLPCSFKRKKLGSYEPLVFGTSIHNPEPVSLKSKLNTYFPLVNAVSESFNVISSAPHTPDASTTKRGSVLLSSHPTFTFSL